ncbi:MAG: hypothetical protein ACJA1B_002713 [Polaribacter sp.]|jgi:hypothetical protein
MISLKKTFYLIKNSLFGINFDSLFSINMKTGKTKPSRIYIGAMMLGLMLMPSLASSQTLYNVVLGTDNTKITEIQLTFNGNIITETSGIGSGSAPAGNETTLPVIMNTVKINDGGIKTLNFFNSLGSFVRNNNFTTIT